VKIRSETASLVKDKFGLSEATTGVLFDSGLFREDIARRMLIRLEYKRLCDQGRQSKTSLKIALSEKYCVSVSTVEKYLRD